MSWRFTRKISPKRSHLNTSTSPNTKLRTNKRKTKMWRSRTTWSRESSSSWANSRSRLKTNWTWWKAAMRIWWSKRKCWKTNSTKSVKTTPHAWNRNILNSTNTSCLSRNASKISKCKLCIWTLNWTPWLTYETRKIWGRSRNLETKSDRNILPSFTVIVKMCTECTIKLLIETHEGKNNKFMNNNDIFTKVNGEKSVSRYN